jgi:hypothetical protein
MADLITPALTHLFPGDVGERLHRLESIQAIQALKARYAGLADQKYTADRRRQPPERMREVARLQAACFTEDAVWEGGKGFGDDLVGRKLLEEWFNTSPWCFAAHYYGSPTIAVDGDTARGSWRLWQLALRDANQEAVLLAAQTDEEYARQPDGNWLHSRVRFSQMHILPMPFGANPLFSNLVDIP